MNVSELLNELETEELSQYVEVVSEPEYSKGKLNEFENKYQLSSEYVSENKNSEVVSKLISPSDLSEWLYNINLYNKIK